MSEPEDEKQYEITPTGRRRDNEPKLQQVPLRVNKLKTEFKISPLFSITWRMVAAPIDLSGCRHTRMELIDQGDFQFMRCVDCGELSYEPVQSVEPTRPKVIED